MKNKKYKHKEINIKLSYSISFSVANPSFIFCLISLFDFLAIIYIPKRLSNIDGFEFMSLFAVLSSG